MSKAKMMQFGTWSGVFLVVMLLILAYYPIQAAVLFSEDFEDGNFNGWSTSGGSWSVVTDGTKVDKQSSVSANAHTYTGTATWSNYTVKARVKLLSFNGTDRPVGLCARFQSSSNFYALTVSNANKLEIRKKASGSFTTLASKAYTAQTGTWYDFKLVVNGSNITAYVNDVLELTASDSSFATGRIGFMTVNASAEFDDVSVEDISAATPTPTATATATPTPTATRPGDNTPTPTPTQNVASGYYVAPFGNDSNPGTFAQPYYSLAKAVAVATAGDAIYLRGGTYNYSATINLSQSGTASAPIRIWAFPGELPVLNYSSQPYGANNRGINLTGSYWHLKGLEICYAGDNGLKIEGNNNTIEQCVFHHNGDSGVQLGFGHTTANPDGQLCANNLILNCDSYLNFDFDNMGSDADGFACKMHNGKGNVFRGCRSWRNSDDGWDLFETDWPVIIENCWTWHNGDKTDFDAIYLAKMGKTMSSFQGNGNGFKLGGNGTGGSSKGTHEVRNCVSFDNNFKSKKGFDQNSHKGGVILYNCTAFGNGYNYMFEDSASSPAQNIFKNNVAFACKGSLDHEFNSGAILDHNSWDLAVTADSADFLSLSEDLAKAARQADGGLPNNDFAKLAAGSDLIDKGVNVGLPYLGAAPDLGAFERQ